LSNKIKALFIIFAGLILVGIGVLASYLLLQRFQAEQTPPLQVVEIDTVRTDVVVTTRDLFLGDRLEPGDVALTSVPVENAPRTALASVDEALGKFIKADLVQGQMVLSHNLADPTNKAQDLSFILSDEHVLLAFPAEDLMSLENVPQRGDIIDILATFILEIEPPEEEDAVLAPGEEEEEPEPITRTYTLDAQQRVGVTALVVDIIEVEVEEDEEGQEGEVELQPGQTAEGAPTRVTNIRAYLLALDPQDALILKHLKDIGGIFDIVVRAPTSTVQFELDTVTDKFLVELYNLDILPLGEEE
jgi:pilus assembly protein CpaB